MKQEGEPCITVLILGRSSAGHFARWAPRTVVLKSRRLSTGHDVRLGAPHYGIKVRRRLGLMQDGCPPIMALKSKQSSTGHDARWASLHYGIEIKATVIWAWCKMGALYYGIEIGEGLATGQDGHATLWRWNQGHCQLSLMQMDAPHCNIEIRVIGDWAWWKVGADFYGI